MLQFALQLTAYVHVDSARMWERVECFIGLSVFECVRESNASFVHLFS